MVVSLIWCGESSYTTTTYIGTPEIQQNNFISQFAILIPFMSLQWHTSCETKRNKANFKIKILARLHLYTVLARNHYTYTNSIGGGSSMFGYQVLMFRIRSVQVRKLRLFNHFSFRISSCWIVLSIKLQTDTKYIYIGGQVHDIFGSMVYMRGWIRVPYGKLYMRSSLFRL